MPSDRLPKPPPVPAEAREVALTHRPPAPTEHDLAVELVSLRADLRCLARTYGVCGGCGAQAGEPGVFCDCESPASAGDYEMW
jgi:hypothetical protein